MIRTNPHSFNLQLIYQYFEIIIACVLMKIFKFCMTLFQFDSNSDGLRWRTDVGSVLGSLLMEDPTHIEDIHLRLCDYNWQAHYRRKILIDIWQMLLNKQYYCFVCCYIPYTCCLKGSWYANNSLNYELND